MIARIMILRKDDRRDDLPVSRRKGSIIAKLSLLACFLSNITPNNSSLAGQFGEYSSFIVPINEVETSQQIAQGPGGAGVSIQAAMKDADALARSGKYQEAAAQWLKILEVFESKLGKDNRNTATVLNNLGFLHERMGAYKEASTFHERALRIRLRILGESHPETATTYSNLADVLSSQGKLAEAKQLYERSLRILENALGQVHPTTLVAQGKLGQLYLKQGLPNLGVPLLEKSIRGSLRNNNGRHPDTFLLLQSLGYGLAQLGENERAANLLETVSQLESNTPGVNPFSAATTLSSLAGIYLRLGQYSKAEPPAKRALAIYERLLGNNHLGLGLPLNNLGMVYERQGKLDHAEPLLRRVLEIRQADSTVSSTDLAKSLNNLAVLYLKKNQDALAISYLEQSLAVETLYLLRELSLSPMRSRRLQILNLGSAWELSHAMSLKSAAGANLSLVTRLNRHGLLQEIEQRQTLLARDPVHRKLADQITALDAQRADTATALNRKQLESIKTLKDQLEQQLYRLLPQLRPGLVSLQQVANALPQESILVEFQKFRPFKPQESDGFPSGEAQYQALILKPNGTVQAVSLGKAAIIDTAITRMLTSLEQSTADAPERLAAVRRLVIDPIQPTTGTYNRWFLSPDSELNRVPFLALPSTDPGSKPLSERVKLQVLTTGRELLRLQKPSLQGSSALVMADPQFDRAGSVNAQVTTTASAESSQRRSSDLSVKNWKRLKATEREGIEVGMLLSTTAIVGKDATSLRLQQMKPPKILHVATHGFFLSDQLPSNEVGSGIGDLSSGLLAPLAKEEPMLRSGLVLAGANQPTANKLDDGYLTAAEAASLPLQATELVVLSACSTGQGEAQTGEGVYGLQRALAVAGARSTLLSLWKVDDAATREFMVRFYKLLKQGIGRAEALQMVQAEFRTKPKQSEWSHPYYWAAWQLSGDWRPITGF